jgi:hypothetical protein
MARSRSIDSDCAAWNSQGSGATMNIQSRTRRLRLIHQDGSLRWLARLVANRGVSLALVAAVVIVDFTIPWPGMSFVPRALVDEPCAVATALVILGALTRFRGTPPDPKFGWSMLALSVLVDVDHLPLEFGSPVLTAGTPRPYFHALWVVVILTAATIVARYWSQRAKTPASSTTMNILAGAALGISAHFLRDVATAPMSLWWPVTKAAVEVPHWWYVLALLIIIVIPPARSSMSAAEEQSSEHAATLSIDAGTSTRLDRRKCPKGA